MICKTCGANMPDGVKFCSTCGSILSVEPAAPEPPAYQPPVAPAASAEPDFDATIIADDPAEAPVAPIIPEPPAYKAPVAAAAPEAPAAPVAPAQPVAPVQPAASVYQSPVAPATPAQPVYQTPVAPAYQAPAYTPAAPKKKLDTKMIAIIGGVVAVIVAIVLIAVFAGGGKKKNDDPKTKSDSVATVVKEYFTDELEYYDYEVSGFKSEYKVSSDDAYIQIVSANLEYEDEKGYMLGYVLVCGDEVIEAEYDEYSSDDKDSFNEDRDSLVDDLKNNKEDVIEELEEIAEYY